MLLHRSTLLSSPSSLTVAQVNVLDDSADNKYEQSYTNDSDRVTSSTLSRLINPLKITQSNTSGGKLQ